jgi:hypothetical protein
MAYNGWSNYETWSVAFWLDEPERRPLMKAYVLNSPSITRSAKYIESYVRNVFPTFGTTVFALLIKHALEQVDWHEIAEHYLDTVEEEQ